MSRFEVKSIYGLKSLEWKTIEEVIISLKTGLNPRQNFSLNEEGSIFPYITGKDIFDNNINVTDRTDKITPTALELINKRAKLESGLLLFASTGTGTVGRMAIIHNYCNDWGISETLYAIKVNSTMILTNYLMHFLYSSVAKNQFEPKISKGSVPHLKVKDLLNVKIPVPPLEVQREIVKVLDNFTELTARKQQYLYYLNRFFENSNAETVPLASLGTLTRGKRFVHADATDEGVPCIHYGELYTYYGVYTNEVRSHIREDLRSKMRYAKNGDVIIVGAGENKDDIGVGVAWYGEEDVAVHDACYTLSHKQNPKYISYFLRSKMYHQQIVKYVYEGKICSISAENVGKALIPIPSIEEQDRIVSILDRFDKLCTDLSFGLPAEIEARRKQYEYYRDKLLSFNAK